MELSREDMELLNYRLADVLVYIKGYRAAIESNPQGNKTARNAQIELCKWIEDNLTDSKKIVSQVIYKESV